MKRTVLESMVLSYMAVLWVMLAFVLYFALGCSARIQNATSIEWGETTGEAASKMSIEQDKKIQGAI